MTTGRYCRISVNGVHLGKSLLLGENLNIGDNVSIRCADKSIIGKNVLIGSKVLIIDKSHGTYSGTKQDDPITHPNELKSSTLQIVIEDNVWIGKVDVIQQGVTIGRDSIIAANSIVIKDIHCGVIAGGILCKVIKVFSKERYEWVKNI